MTRFIRSVQLAMVVALLPIAHDRAFAEDSLDGRLKPYLSQFELPGLAAAVVQDGEIIALGAVGTRKVGEEIPVTANDRFHLGSDTKAMTSLLAAMFVEQGKLRWDSTIGEVFPELVEGMDPGLRDVTLTQLLSHTSGIPSDDEAFWQQMGEATLEKGNLDEIRYGLVRGWRTRPLVAAPGTQFAYSNLGYVIAGVMIERVSEKTWDELITERIFEPLGLETAGLGSQASLGKIDAPLGHERIDGRIKAFLAGPNGDNSPVVGPAGIAHMSVRDFARWAGWNAGEGRREPGLVRPETLRKLHKSVISMPTNPDAAPGTPSHGEYALGWGRVTVDWAPHPLIYHGGSNEKNLAHLWIDPERDFAIVILTNISTPEANTALLKLAQELSGLYAKPD